jgi:hypothetical protein
MNSIMKALSGVFLFSVGVVCGLFFGTFLASHRIEPQATQTRTLMYDIHYEVM